MAYLVINDSPDRGDASRESDELVDLDRVVSLAERLYRQTLEPLRVVDAETGHTLLYFGHAGYRCVDRRRVRSGGYQLDGGFSRPFEHLDDAIARAAKQLLSCIHRGIEAMIEVVDGNGRVYWRNGRPV